MIPPIPHFSIKTTTQVVCSILSCLLWTVEQYLPCALTHDSYTETPPQKLNVNVLHSVLRCTYHAHGHPADAGIQEACAGVGRHFALEIVGSFPWYAMVLYLFPAQKKKKNNAFQLGSPYELVHLQWLLGIPYNTVKLTMQFFFS